MSNPVAVARVKIAKMEAECARMQAEIAKLRDFITLFDELSDGVAQVIVEPGAVPLPSVATNVEGNVTLQTPPVDNSDVVRKRRLRPKSELRPAQTAELMERIIREIGRPLTRGEIVEAFERRDVLIPFEDKARYIGTIAWRHKGLFINIDGRGYWLRDEPVPPETQPSLGEFET